jgi:hypothetical protein
MKLIKFFVGLLFLGFSLSYACELPEKNYTFTILMNKQIIQKDFCGSLEKNKVSKILDELNNYLIENNLNNNYKIISIEENSKLVTIN